MRNIANTWGMVKTIPHFFSTFFHFHLAPIEKILYYTI